MAALATLEKVQAQRRSWIAFLKPSLSDIFFFSILAWSFLIPPVGWDSLLVDGDAGLHIRVGDYILSHGAVPHTDPFSFSRPGATWYAHEWLAEMSYSLLHSAFGLKGLVLVSGVIIAMTMLVLLQHMVWKGVNVLLALVLVYAADNAVSAHFHARPHLVTLLFLAISLWLVSADRAKKGRWVWGLVPLTALWANLHGAYPIVLVYLALVVAGCCVEAFLWMDTRRERIADAKRYFVLAVLCGLSSLANPYGINLHLHLLKTVQAKWMLDVIAEYKSPSFRTESMLLYMALLFLGIGLIGSMLRRRNIADPLWLLFLAYESLISARHFPLYVIAATPMVAVELSAMWREFVAGQKRTSIARILEDMAEQLRPAFRGPSIWAVVIVAAIALLPNLSWPADFPAEIFPVKMVNKHRELIASSRVFTTDQWADYLIFRSYPEQRVFFDGRSDFYAAASSDYLSLLQGNGRYREILAKWDINLALCPVGSPLTTILKMDPGWTLIEDDGQEILFQRLAAP